MSAKIRVRMGQIEVEYEGPETFLKDELKDLLSGVLELHREASIGGEKTLATVDTSKERTSSPRYLGTTNTWSAKLGVKSGTDLIISAMAKKTLVDRLEKCTRSEILGEMQEATSYYKSSYRGNLTGYLKTLVSSDRLRELSKDTYSLSASELEKVKAAYDS